VQLTMLATHGLHVLKNRVGVGAVFWIIGLGGFVLTAIIVLVLGFYQVLRLPRRKSPL
jgi:hypothetical protein